MIEFTKLSGSGNDFICIDNRNGRFDYILEDPEALCRFSRVLCRRGKGIGADGIVFASIPKIDCGAELEATFLEADGSIASLCGNGTACFVRWARDQGISHDHEVDICTPAGVVVGQLLEDGDGYVRVCVPHPRNMQKDLYLNAKGYLLSCDYAEIGVEHLITYVEDINEVDVSNLGKALRNHDHFPQPKGVNANFVQVLAEGKIAIRTFEYGVESETLACGTGSAAAAIMASKRFNWPVPDKDNQKPVYVHAKSGDVLRIYFDLDGDQKVKAPCLETKVRCIYSGKLADAIASEALGTQKC